MSVNMKYTLSALVLNHAGVLSQVTRLFSRRGYNIESLAVGVTDDPELSRITIMLSGDAKAAEQIVAQFKKLLSVKTVAVLPEKESVRRELMLLKVAAKERGQRDEIIQMAGIFRARIIDVSRESLTLEITGEQDKTSAFLELLREYGILEVARTGCVALERGGGTISSENKERLEYQMGKGSEDAQ